MDKKTNKKILIGGIALIAVLIIVFALVKGIIPSIRYNSAMSLMEQGKYEEALPVIEALGSYNDCEEKASECRTGIQYNAAVSLMKEEKYKEAITAFSQVKDFKDSKEQIADCETALQYENALSLMNAGEYEAAIIVFEALDGYKDSAEKIAKCEAAINEEAYKDAVSLMEAGEYEMAIVAFEALGEYKDSAEKIAECETALYDESYAYAVSLMHLEKYDDAIKAFEELNGYKDSAVKIEECRTALKEIAYNNGTALMRAGKYKEAIAAFKEAGDYKDSAVQLVDCQTALNEINYNAANALLKDEKYEEALTAFLELKDYKDSIRKADEISCYFEIEKMKSAEVGDAVYFGAYEQDNDKANGKEDIEWIVLEKTDTSLLVISRYALECQPFNTKNEDVTWESSSIRAWLNKDFLKTAFTAAEQSKLASSRVASDKNPEKNTDPGKATNDKVFLLGISEAEKYFTDDAARKCASTPSARAQGIDTSKTADKTDDGESTCWWWLRSPGEEQNRAAYVYNDGSIYSVGLNVYIVSDSIRPVIRINID